MNSSVLEWAQINGIKDHSFGSSTGVEFMAGNSTFELSLGYLDCWSEARNGGKQ